MKNILLIIFNLLLISSTIAQRFDWASTGGATGIANSFSGAGDIARDPQGNIYTFDYSNHAQQCQGDTLQPFASVTAYIYKFNSQGVLLFMNRVGAVGGGFTPFNIEIDDAGSLYLLGQPDGVAFIIVNEDTIPTIASTNQLIKIDSNGNFVWKHNTGASTSGDGCMLHYSNGYLYYQSGNLSVSKIDTAGIVGANLTASYYSSPTASSGLLFKGSSVFPNGDLLFAAYSRGTVAYGIDTLFHIGNPFLTAPFLFVRCDTSMNLVWAKYASNGRNPDNKFIPVAIDSNENVYAAVQVNSEMIIGNDTILTAGFTGQGAIIKLDGAGNGIWAHALQSSGLAYAWCMQKATEDSGIIIGGGYTGTAQLGTFTLNAASQSLPFVAKFDANGNYTNAFNYLQDPTQTDALSMAADNNGNYYVGGKLSNNTVPVFSCSPAIGNKGFYIGKFSEQPNNVPVPTISVEAQLLTANPIFSGEINWYLNGNLIENENGQTLIASQNGYYSVEYVYSTGCVGSESSIVQNVILNSIKSSSINQELSIYPNPSSGLYTIKSDIKFKKVLVRNATGSILFESSDFNSNQQIDIQNTKPGIYFIELTNENSIHQLRLIKY